MVWLGVQVEVRRLYFQDQKLITKFVIMNNLSFIDVSDELLEIFKNRSAVAIELVPHLIASCRWQEHRAKLSAGSRKKTPYHQKIRAAVIRADQETNRLGSQNLLLRYRVRKVEIFLEKHHEDFKLTSCPAARTIRKILKSIQIQDTFHFPSRIQLHYRFLT